MIDIDFDYLRRCDALEPNETQRLLADPQFLTAQEDLFATIHRIGGTVDFDIADMREVHISAALGTSVRDAHVLDIACGSMEEYVLDDTFRDRYPPLLAEMLEAQGAHVTGVDVRPNPGATYAHLTRDLTNAAWTDGLERQFDVTTCISLFNAPKSPFLSDLTACDTLLDQIRNTLKPNGVLIATLPDQLLLEDTPNEQRWKIADQYLQERGWHLLHIGKGMVWAR